MTTTLTDTEAVTNTDNTLSKTATYTLNTLPENIKEVFLKTRYVSNIDEHRNNSTNSEVGLLALIETNNKPVQLNIEETPLIWGTDNHLDQGKTYTSNSPLNNLSIIIPRSEKSKALQKLRTKEKAEVFTPSWIANKQNNLIDSTTGNFKNNQTLSKFNKETTQGSWETTNSPIFPNTNDGNKAAAEYILRKVLEITCGEAPYLVSPYDTVTGQTIPVQENGKYMRIGLLDRKLRVVSEVADKETWYGLALEAITNTYGYEWQGDNLLLARLNILNTFIEYYENFHKTAPSESKIENVAEIISWNLWQMDGLKMVQPMSCSDHCPSCLKKLTVGHDGRVPAIKISGQVIPFEDMLKDL